MSNGNVMGALPSLTSPCALRIPPRCRCSLIVILVAGAGKELPQPAGRILKQRLRDRIVLRLFVASLPDPALVQQVDGRLRVCQQNRNAQ